MEPDRFDDVAFRMIERPEPLPSRTRLRRRVALVLTTAIVSAGGLAAGADALTTSGGEAARPAASQPRPHVVYDADGVPTVRSGYECPAGAGKGHGARKRHHDTASPRH